MSSLNHANYQCVGRDATLPNPAMMEWSPPLKQHYSIADQSETFWI